MYPALRLISGGGQRGFGERGAPGGKPRNGNSHTSTILVAEDEVLIRMAASDFLRYCGYRVLEAANATEALALFRAGEPIEVVFSDVNMPGEMNGFELAEWVHQQYPDVKVILTSGVMQAADPDTPLMQKPYDHDDLLARIKKLLMD
jgi:CheY-like chemotaxis protein